MSVRHERAQWARLDIDGVVLLADLATPVGLARALQFTPPLVRWFGAAAAQSMPLVAPGFAGRVADGAPCNCSVLTFTPHANGTHTECVGHLTVEPLDAYRVVPQRLLPTVLVSVQPQRANECSETSTPAPAADDQLITRAALRASWPTELSHRLTARALVIRTLPNPPDKFTQHDSADSAGATPSMAPFLSAQAATELVERGIQHVVLDLPSIDRVEDGGTLCAHRIFFGLPAHSHSLADAQRRDCTITELAYVEDRLVDGWYLMSLQAVAIPGDAVPSRPLLYPLLLG